ncbi:hypothetical protein [Mycobacteroides abscessus]|uniref:hypothetical protein n=1 Tax=Mycobacteroides abscessus TaxID=36809 RepID=UPI001896700E
MTGRDESLSAERLRAGLDSVGGDFKTVVVDTGPSMLLGSLNAVTDGRDEGSCSR